MTAYPTEFPNPLLEVNVWRKMKDIDLVAEQVLTRPESFQIPHLPGRDVPLRKEGERDGGRKGLSQKEGRARLLHDLVGIELQAFELGLRTLIEYPEAPKFFREELLKITLEESKHLRLCLEALKRMGYEFGHWNTHLHLWQSVAAKEPLLDRIVIVHRYLEGAGLDASEMLLNRLTGVDDPVLKQVLKVIAEEEVDHVRFGSQWFQKLVKESGADPDDDFKVRMNRIKYQVPARHIPLAKEARKKAGFSDGELETAEAVRVYFLTEPPPLHR